MNKEHEPNILVFGGMNVDSFIQTSVMPKPGESVVGQSFRQGLGGKGANQAVAAARLGARVTIVGQVGFDHYGDLMLSALEREGINTRFVLRTEAASTGLV